jgi:6-phosphofructokinase
LLLTFNLIKKSRKKERENRKIKSKIQEDIHEESLEYIVQVGGEGPQ